MLFSPAPVPKKALLKPVALDCPAFTPAKVLFLPVTLNTRLPPMLYCVAALTAFAESVPPVVPLPLMLKFVPDPGVVFWM